jgi:hypothetical protein
MSNKKEWVFYRGGYIPKEKIEAEKKISNLLENPPTFDPLNKNEIKQWLKNILKLYK